MTNEYKEALKRLPKDERVVAMHLEQLLADTKAVRVATVLKGQEANIAAAIETEVMAHLMPKFLQEIGKERSKIKTLIEELDQSVKRYNTDRAELRKLVAKFESDLAILVHIKALAIEGKVKVTIPSEDEMRKYLDSLAVDKVPETPVVEGL